MASFLHSKGDKMGSLRIEQYAGQALGHRGDLPIPELNLSAAAENLNTSGISAASAVLQKNTRAVFVRSTGGTNVAVRVGNIVPSDPVALVTDASVVNGEGRWFGIPPALAGYDIKIAAIDY